MRTPMRVLAGLLTTSALVLAASSAQATTIADTVRATVATNPEIGVVRNDRLAVDQELQQARALGLPTLDLRIAGGPEYTNSIGTRARNDSNGRFRTDTSLTLTQRVFDGGATRSEIDRQLARVDSAANRVREAAEFIALDGIQAHLDYLRNLDLIALADANVAAHRRILGEVRDLEAGGTTGIADVRQAEARLAAAVDSLEQIRGDFANAGSTYLQVVGMAPLDLQLEEPPTAALPGGIEAAALRASSSSPTVQIAASDVDVATAEVRAARAGYYPRLNVEAGASTANDVNGVDGSDVSAEVLLVMRYNLFRGGADVAQEREAFHRLNEARSSLARVRRQAEEDARSAFIALDTATARIETLRLQVEANRRTRDAYADQFIVGQRTLLDLLDAENELFVSRVNLTTAEYQQRFAVYRTITITGALLDTLGVERPREEINIERTPERLHTPERIERKSLQLESLSAEPRPLRGRSAGEPAALPGNPGLSDPVGTEPAAADTSQAAPIEVAPEAGPDGPLPEDTAGLAGIEPTAGPAPAPSQGGASYESFGSFWNAITGD
ncbi:TolC family outer membrane protein [Geminicoccus harenae]|uniref:TolC family outer membrane protein n=2 Tax=Geminicoccus harenae TaxID=2498453 RepID=UPI001C9706EF|nr:TolC family outer membrane protein [Geminicoccus harenae]